MALICQDLTGKHPTPSDPISAEEIITAAAPLIFDGVYLPVDGPMKSTVQAAIVRHFYMREIGLPTYEWWHLRLVDHFIGHGQKYAVMLDQWEKIQWMQTHDRTTSEKTDTSSTTTTTSSTTSSTDTTSTTVDTISDKKKYSKTPQGTIANVDNASYLTDYTADDQSRNGSATGKTDGSSSGTGKNEGTGESTLTRTETGREGFSAADLWSALSDAAPPMQKIFDDLEQLFVTLWE